MVKNKKVTEMIADTIKTIPDLENMIISKWVGAGIWEARKPAQKYHSFDWDVNIFPKYFE
jgi:hypothetical protein